MNVLTELAGVNERPGKGGGQVQVMQPGDRKIVRPALSRAGIQEKFISVIVIYLWKIN